MMKSVIEERKAQNAKIVILQKHSKTCNTCGCKISENFGTNWHDTPECLTCENNPYKISEVITP